MADIGLYLARHGVTEANAQGRRLGSLDEPLSETGREQARTLARAAAAAGITEVRSSPQLRALETAGIVAGELGDPVVIEPDLREMTLGPWEGLTEEQIANAFPEPYRRWREDPVEFRMDGHEPLTAVRDRVIAALERIMHDSPRALCVTHLAPIRIACTHFAGRPLNEFALTRPEHCELIRLVIPRARNWKPPIGMGRRVCVDLNGVLDTYRGWQGRVTWHEPRAGAAEFLRALRERGHEVVVLTTRDPDEARAWLRRHGLAQFVDDVTDRKPAALAYIDDRALPFRGRFDQTLRELERFRPFWEEDGAVSDHDAEVRRMAVTILRSLGHRIEEDELFEVVRRDRRSNRVDEVHLRDGRILVVKRAKDPDADRFHTSRLAADLLAESDVVTPNYIPLPPDLAGQPVLAYWWVPGRTLHDLWPRVPAGERPAVVQRWGRLVRRIHEVELKGHGALADALERPRSLASFLRTDLADRLRPAVEGVWPAALDVVDSLLDAVPRIDHDGPPAHLVHNDLFDQNVLCRRAGDDVLCVGVLDFEDAFAGPVEADLAKAELLHGPLFGQPWLDWDWFAELLAGYGREPDPVRLAFFRAFQLVNMGWHAALTGLEDHAARLAIVARAEAAALGSGRSHADIAASAA